MLVHRDRSYAAAAAQTAKKLLRLNAAKRKSREPSRSAAFRSSGAARPAGQ